MKTNLFLILSFFTFLLFFSFVGCKDEQETLEPNIYLELDRDTLVCKQSASVCVVTVKSNVEWTAKVAADATWCTVKPVDNLIEIQLEANLGNTIRETNVELASSVLKAKLYIKQLGMEPDILLSTNRLNLTHKDSIVNLEVVSNVEYEIFIPDTVDWIIPVSGTRAEMVESTESFHVLANETEEDRTTEITFRGEPSLEKVVKVIQKYRNKTYDPVNPDGLEDILIPISSSWANQAQGGEGIERSHDGNYGTIYHSPWYDTKFPVILEYGFSTPQLIDFMTYYPRSDGSNGVFGEIEISVAGPDSQFKPIGTFDLKKSTSPSFVNFAEPQENVKKVRIQVNSGGYGLVSCAEIEFYRRAVALTGLDDIFADELYSELRPEVTQREIDGMDNEFFRTVAQSLLDKTYNVAYRVQEYEPFRPLNDLQREMKTSPYCAFENPTGLYFKKGDNVVVIVGPTNGEKISLNIFDFNRAMAGNPQGGNFDNVRLPLHEGINSIKLTDGGLGYIDYFTENYKTASKIKIHIASGEVNGYFDKKNSDPAKWRETIENAPYGCFDLKGERINLCFSTSHLKELCYDPVSLIQRYDDFVDLEHEVMGLDKYNRIPKNHMFARTIHEGLYADGWGAAFDIGCMRDFADPTKLPQNGSWAIAHELGHVNQLQPGLMWQGTTEVTNNVYSVLSTYKWNREIVNLERQSANDGYYNDILGGRFNSYLNYGVIKGEQWHCQRGQDAMDNYENGGDYFVKLCPIWQLLLYYRIIHGDEHHDWYGDVCEIVRTTSQDGLSNGQHQLNFMKNTADVLKQNLSVFFEKSGMLKPIDKDITDYSSGHLTITERDCEELKKYMSKYPEPETPVLYYVNANCEDAFRKHLAVEGTYNEGVVMESFTRAKIFHDVWKNVVVFETYEGDKPVRASIVGTGSKNLDYTIVFYPEGSTRIEAVGWDGTRTLVYGER